MVCHFQSWRGVEILEQLLLRLNTGWHIAGWHSAAVKCHRRNLVKMLLDSKRLHPSSSKATWWQTLRSPRVSRAFAPSSRRSCTRLLSAFVVQRFQLAAVANSVAMATKGRQRLQELILLCLSFFMPPQEHRIDGSIKRKRLSATSGCSEPTGSIRTRSWGSSSGAACMPQAAAIHCQRTFINTYSGNWYNSQFNVNWE